MKRYYNVDGTEYFPSPEELKGESWSYCYVPDAISVFNPIEEAHDEHSE
jgi:hypothetical protein